VRFAVTGGRKYGDGITVCRALIDLPGADDDTVLVHGAAQGADRLAADLWGIVLGRPLEPHPATWAAACRPTCRPGHRRPYASSPGVVPTLVRDFCPAAGNYRNQEMVDSGLDLLVAFPGGSGTADMIQRARDAGVPVQHG
jgi:hypothetical protein